MAWPIPSSTPPRRRAPARDAERGCARTPLRLSQDHGPRHPLRAHRDPIASSSRCWVRQTSRPRGDAYAPLALPGPHTGAARSTPRPAGLAEFVCGHEADDGRPASSSSRGSGRGAYPPRWRPDHLGVQPRLGPGARRHHGERAPGQPLRGARHRPELSMDLRAREQPITSASSAPSHDAQAHHD